MPRWDVVNLDTVRFDGAVADSVLTRTPPKRFRRLAHAFNIHSWAPASYDPYALSEESHIAFNLGATIMSQNILSTLEGFATWGVIALLAGLFFGLRYSIVGKELGKPAVNDAMDKAANAVENVRETVEDSLRKEK